jgi:hypothetical protein
MPAKIFGVNNALMKVKKNINVQFLKVSFKIATSQVVLWIGNILMLANKDVGKHKSRVADPDPHGSALI